MFWAVFSNGIIPCKDRWEHSADFNIVKKCFVTYFLIVDKIDIGSKSLNQCGSTWIHVIKSFRTRLEKLFLGKFNKGIENHA